jgi:hypothetical protein
MLPGLRGYRDDVGPFGREHFSIIGIRPDFGVGRGSTVFLGLRLRAPGLGVAGGNEAQALRVLGESLYVLEADAAAADEGDRLLRNDAPPVVPSVA